MQDPAPAPPPVTPPAPPPPARRRLPWFTSMAGVLGPALLVLSAAAAALLWIATTQSGLRLAAAAVSALVPGVTISEVDGSLRDGFRVHTLGIAQPRWSLRIEGLAVQTGDWAPFAAHVELQRVAAQRVRIDWVPGDDAPVTPPASLALPFDLTVRDLSVAELAFGARGATPTVLRDVALAGRAGAQRIRIDSARATLDRTRLSGNGQVDALPPFATSADLQLTTELRGRAVSAVAAARGPLRALQVAVQANDDAARAQIDADVDAFAAVPLRRLDATIAAFDPALWFSGTPAMQLSGNAQFAPVIRPDGAWSLAGPLQISNATPGTVDSGRLPVRAARGTLAWAASDVAITVDHIDGARGTGSGSFHWRDTTGIDARLAFSGIDGAALHSALRPTKATGQLRYRLADGVHRFDGGARNSGGLPLVAEIAATLRDDLLELARGELRLGTGRADLRGRLALRAPQAGELAGSFGDLDLGQLVRGLDTRLNGTVDLSGELQSRRGRARFVLNDSRIAGRPITGGGTVALADGRLDADAELRSGPAWLAARGGLGAGRELRIDLVVPDLKPLMPGYGGRVEAHAVLAGELKAVRITGDAGALDLLLPGGHRVTSIIANVVAGLAPDAPLAVRVDLAKHSAPAGPDSSIAGATLLGRGTTSNASFELTGATGGQQPLHVLVNGGLQDREWRGALVAVEIGLPLQLLMRTPAKLVLAPGVVEFGPADFQMRGATFSAVELKKVDGRWRSSGSFEGLQPQALDAAARAPRRAVRSAAGDRVPLTLAGRWSLEWTDSVTGIAVIERTGGDLYSGVDGLNPIGVSDVGAALNVLNNRVTGNVYVRGRALGRIDADIDAYLDPSDTGGYLLAQQRPFRVAVDADLPDLSWLGPLIDDNVQFGGRGTVKALVGGTPAEPTSTGTLQGTDLRLAWVDHAIRMENGKLDAVLEDGVLVIRDIVFTGRPRIAPPDVRAMEDLVTTKPFEVRATGRFALATLAGSIGVRATQLPILQRTDRWMVVSGDGGITLTPKQADVYARLTVDGAYINFDAMRAARSLPGDVVVRRPGERKRDVDKPPMAVNVQVQGNLGRRFYIEGAGLHTRLAGAVTVSGRPSQLRAEGSVRALDGIFSNYGQRLNIERGIVTFHGPIDNPTLNVLAIRAGLPVEVGVAISGTAQRPIVRLHSDPAMSDTEKLNWLVLGRPPGAADGNDRALLSAAASALFSGQMDAASAGLMRNLGIDQITLQPGQSSSSLLPRETVAGRLRSGGVTTSSSAAADFVAVGKRINEDLYLSFEQALTGAEYFVALNYRLTRALSLIARAGSTNSLDLVYTVAFD